MKQMWIPGSFCVGEDILERFADLAGSYGTRFTFVGGKRSLEAARGKLEKSFAKSTCTADFVECGRIVCLSEIERIMQLSEVAGADVVCAVGGGTAMDIARTAANRMHKALVMIPTTVASDATCSCVSVFYSEDGSQVVGDELFHKCPDLVVVDSRIIAEAPLRQLAAGMGDALSTWYEASTCAKGVLGKGMTETAVALGALCREIILKDGLAAYESVEAHRVTDALERVIEANCFLSGVGGANTGCAAAHGIGDYLCHLPNGHAYMHGERVYVGLMVQLILEAYPQEETVRLMRFGKTVGLPLCIADLGVSNLEKTARELAAGLQGDHFMEHLQCDYSKYVLANAFIKACDMAKTSC